MPKFGEKIKFTHRGHKRSVRLGDIEIPMRPLTGDMHSGMGSGPYKVWSMWTRLAYPYPVEGIYIGKRRLYDGTVRYEGEEIGNVFSRKRRHDALLVVINEHQNPIYVFPEDVIED